jgi:2-polyprenyl-3-methyl-5-hydroxy-6-metoxy-1,4-benzoquinol methylase
MLCERDVFVRLARALEKDPHLSCAIAVDVFNDPPEQSLPFPYYSWRGFCLFQHALAKQCGAVRPYDGRRTFLFLLKPDHIPGSVPSTCPVLDIPKHIQKQSAGIVPQAFIHPLDNYHDQERKDVLALLPQAIASLLDVGCGSGRFGALVKKERGCRVVGVELDPSAAAEAANRLDKVIQGDILKAQLDEKFDVITCNDLLEHLEDPSALLHILKKHLQPAGVLLLSVPNVGHWSIIDDLLAGHWDYIPAGLLCISHLRFFTRKSIINLMTVCGWHVTRVEIQHGPFVGSAKDRFMHLGDLGFEVASDDLEVLGFYVLAQ